MRRRHSTTGVKSRGVRPSDYPFTLAVETTSRTVGGSSSVSTVQDESVTTVTAASVTTEGRVAVTALLDGVVPTLTNTTPSVASFDPSTGQLTRIADGTARVNVSVGSFIAQAAVPVSIAGGASSSTVTGFASGSLAKHCYDWFVAAVSGKTPNATTQNFLAGDGSRSATIWANAVDLSSIFTSASSGWQQGALIAPRFGIIASHVGTSNGATHTCHTSAGVAVTRTVVGVTNLGSDVQLVCFDSAFTGITPAKILPATFGAKYKPGQFLRQGVPILKWKRMSTPWKIGVGVGNGYTGLSYPRPTEFENWYVEWQGGDSGSPFGTVINGSFVFLGCAWTGPGSNDDGGSFLASNISGLQSAMNALVAGSSSTLDFVDLSGFPSYA